MEQLVLDIHSDSDAAQIKELLKKFTNVEVLSFSHSLSSTDLQQRIAQGLGDADAGRTKPWEEVMSDLTNRIQNYGK